MSKELGTCWLVVSLLVLGWLLNVWAIHGLQQELDQLQRDMIMLDETRGE